MTKERTPIINPGFYAITTKYFGPTDTGGSRITAKVAGSNVSLVRGYDHILDGPANHAAAAVALANIQKSEGRWAEDINLVQGSTDDGYVFVLRWGEEPS
jgi:hypothetical protein